MNSVDFLLLTLVFFQNKADTSFTVSQMIWAFFEISRDLCGALSFVPERFLFFFFCCSRCDRARLGRPLWPFGASPVSADVTGSGVARSRAFARPPTGSSSGMSWCGLVLALFFIYFLPLSLPFSL